MTAIPPLPKPADLPKWEDYPALVDVRAKLEEAARDLAKLRDKFASAERRFNEQREAAARIEGRALIGKATDKDAQAAQAALTARRKELEFARDAVETTEARIAAAREALPEIEAEAKRATAEALRRELVTWATRKAEALKLLMHFEAGVDLCADALVSQFGQYRGGAAMFLVLRDVPWSSPTMILQLAATCVQGRAEAWLKTAREDFGVQV